MYRLRIPDYLVEFIRSLHPGLKRKVKGACKRITAEPYSGKPLKDELEGLRSLRVGRFRIIYQVSDPQEIQVVAIGPRTGIYEETYLLIRKESRDSK
ncbi:MAG: type II toxin-antitoxin system RelE/ParE family toxin [Deltaproteobacteria bacterium]|nr:type II toxin-antitoxin system RelE/ParE family toxin [Deltaproteobacteria bacterium]